MKQDSPLVVAMEVTAVSDQGQLLPALVQAETNSGVKTESVLADAGYANERDLELLEAAGIEGYVALGKERKQTSMSNQV